MKKNRLLLLAMMVLSIGLINAQTVKPQFKGGEEALEKYIEKHSEGNLSMSFSDVDLGEMGIIIRFLVDETGMISSVTAISETSEEVKDMALPIVESMPKWIPGKRKGVAIAMYDTLNLHISVPYISPEEHFVDDEPKELEIRTVEPHEQQPKEVTQERNDVFITVEQMPQYPGGNTELLQFIKDNLRYPIVAAEWGIQGNVLVTFVIEKNGTLSNIKIARSVDPLCDKEAIRIVKLMPKWEPGKQNGKEVAVKYTLPVTFKIQKQEDEKK